MLNEKIKQLRNELKLTQQKCADLAEVNIRLWQKWEKDVTPNVKKSAKDSKNIKNNIRRFAQIKKQGSQINGYPFNMMFVLNP